MLSSQKFLATLVTISESVNKQMPEPPNRYAQFEVCPRDEDREEVNRLYELHEVERENAWIEFHTNEYLNEMFAEYVRENNISLEQELSVANRKLLKRFLLSKSELISKKMNYRAEIMFGHTSTVATEIVLVKLLKNIDSNLDKLCHGEVITLENKDFQLRFQRMLGLIEHRLYLKTQLSCNSHLLLKIAGEKSEQEDIFSKIETLLGAHYVLKNKLSVGLCGEHAHLSIKKILDWGLGNDLKTIEFIRIDYTGGDNHVFLAINRDPESPLKEIRNWGANAFFYDSWNQIVCKAEDFENLPLYYFAYPNGDTWVSTVFTNSDRVLLQSYLKIQEYFAITELEEMEKRIPALMEEYELVSLDMPELANTKEFLYALMHELMPANFNLSVKLYIAISSNKLVSSIVGLPDPNIAIHQNFLTGMVQGGENNVEELRFALAQQLLTIKKCGIGVTDFIPHDQIHLIDREALQKCQNGQAAISFLRKNGELEKKPNLQIGFPLLYETEKMLATSTQRIKTIMTMLARNEKWKGDPDYLPQLSVSIKEELTIIKSKTFFAHRLTETQSTVDKIKILIDALPELWIELLPYEFTQAPSIRVREFCSLLRAMKINLEDAAQFQVVNELLDKAFELRIPAFDRLYLAVQNRDYSHQQRSEYLGLKPLGIFNKLQNTIDAFVQAENFSQAEQSAVDFENLYKQLDTLEGCHFAIYQSYNFSGNFTNTFFRVHNCYPIKTERFFGSEIGRHIDWRGFPQPESKKSWSEYLEWARMHKSEMVASALWNLASWMGLMTAYSTEVKSIPKPWDKHVEWAIKEKRELIAKTLWKFGVQDTAYWSVFSEQQLLTYLDKKQAAFISTSSKKRKKDESRFLWSNDSTEKSQILNYLSQHSILDVSMFTDSPATEENFVAYCKANHLALMHPASHDAKFNVDNEAVHFLLAKFVEIILQPEGNKNIVRRFFTGRGCPGDLKSLMRFTPHVPEAYFEANNLYFRFVIDQQYQDVSFDFFTQKEVMAFLDNMRIDINQITWQQFVKLFKLSYQEFSLDCIENLFPLLEKHKGHFSFFSDYLKQHIKEHAQYSLLSRDAARLTCLAKDWAVFYTRKMLTSFDLTLPASFAAIPDIALADLILMYRTYDTYLLYPSQQELFHFGQLVLEKISLLENSNEKIAALESLLFTVDKKLETPLADIALRNQVIALWVQAIYTQYGKDTMASDYQTNLTAIIDRIYKNAAGRDVALIFSKLANALEMQLKLSEHIGELLEPEKYLLMNKEKACTDTVKSGVLADISEYFGEDEQDQKRFLDFISSPSSQKEVNEFAVYLVDHNKAEGLAEKMGYRSNGTDRAENLLITQSVLHSFYHTFWQLNLEQRAVMIDHLLIPANMVRTDETMLEAYHVGFSYVVDKLFPDHKIVNSDDELAVSFLRAYLETADCYKRGILLSGMLVASNENEITGERASVGKKLALMCEHMGPAYIKMAQAAHSHPHTPEDIRHDFDHIKGRANPPYRWQLWSLITETLLKEDRDKIKYVGQLLGSASYNLALQVEMQDGNKVVLSLLRENAEKDAAAGFEHVRKAIELCDHPRMIAMRPNALTVIAQAEQSSKIEMDHAISRQQFDMAESLYHQTFMIDDKVIHIFPAKLLYSDSGFRFLEEVHGTEFNDLPHHTRAEKQVCNTIAKAIVKMEWVNILRGDCFDSDRHGNQLRIKVAENGCDIHVGLYDFGEMSLQKPSAVEIQQFADVIRGISLASSFWSSFSTTFDQMLSTRIRVAKAANEPTDYLLHIRKGLLALQDFQKHLSTKDMVDIMLEVSCSPAIHPVLASALAERMSILNYAHNFYHSGEVLGRLNCFSTKRARVEGEDAVALGMKRSRGG